MNVLDLLANDNYLIVNRDLVKLLGLRQAVMFGELCSEQNYWNKMAGEDGQWFYSTQENIEDKIGLSPYEQREALKVLEEKGLIERQKKGIPCKTYYRVCLEQVVKIFDNWTSKHLTTGSEENSQLNNNKQDKTKEKTKVSFVENPQKEIKDRIFPKAEAEKAIELWNSIPSLPNVIKLSDKRKLALKNLLKEYDWGQFEQVIENIRTSSFLNGTSGRWQCSFDWILNRNNFLKVLEGQYKDREQNEQKSVGKVAHKPSEYDEGFDENGNFIY